MSNLLTKQDNRRLKFVGLLAETNNWLTLNQISNTLNIPTRTLKEDIRFLNKNFNYFIIHTSVKGIKIKFNNNKGHKSFGQTLLEKSRNYEILEMIFLSDDLSVKDIARKTDLSSATIYRVIHTINMQLKEQFNFSIQTNPCRIVGDEKQIRFYFYTYFFEKYENYQWPFEEIDFVSFEQLFKFIINRMQFFIDFAYFNVLKTIVAVNFIRFKREQFLIVDVNEDILYYIEKILTTKNTKIEKIEENLNIQFNKESILQIFPQYIEKGVSYSFDQFSEQITQNPDIAEAAAYFENIIKNIADKNNIKVPDIHQLSYSLFNTIHIEYKEPQSNYILYDRNTYVSNDIAREYPKFHADLYKGMKDFRQFIKKPLTVSGINFYVYSIFSWWEDLIPQLNENFKKTRLLIVSDRHQTHARLIKDAIYYHFDKQVIIDCFIGIDLEEIKQIDFDILIPTFKIQNPQKLRLVYISNFPRYDDLIQIQHHINEIVLQREK